MKAKECIYVKRMLRVKTNAAEQRPMKRNRFVRSQSCRVSIMRTSSLRLSVKPNFMEGIILQRPFLLLKLFLFL